MNYTIPLDALKVLDEINKKGSFASAADALCKVPSSLTYTIKKIEDDIGTELFDRRQHKAELTEVGKIVLKQGREILNASDRLVETVRQFQSGWEREIRIARDTLVSEQKLIDTCQKFEELEKQVDITLFVEVLGGAWDALYSGKADIIIGGSGEPLVGDIETYKIGELEFVFVVSPEHPLADKVEPLNQDELIRYPSVVIADTSQVLPARSSGLFYTNRVIRVSTIESKLNFQLKGIGVGFIPKHIAAPYIESGQLVIKECKVAKPRQDLYVAWNRKKEGKALMWFIDNLCNQRWLA